MSFDMQVAINILPPELNENYIDFVRGFEEDCNIFSTNTTRI